MLYQWNHQRRVEDSHHRYDLNNIKRNHFWFNQIKFLNIHRWCFFYIKIFTQLHFKFQTCIHVEVFDMCLDQPQVAISHLILISCSLCSMLKYEMSLLILKNKFMLTIRRHITLLQLSIVDNLLSPSAYNVHTIIDHKQLGN